MDLNFENLNFEKLRSLLENICSQIANRFSLHNSNGKPRKATIIDVLANLTCVACIARKLSRKATFENIDALYKECHRLSVNMLVEELYGVLSGMGYRVSISSEVKMDYGKADVLITLTNYGINLQYGTNELTVEVKTGLSLALSQLLRYFLNGRCRTLVVWRVRRRQVLVFDREEVKPLLEQFLRMCIRRGTRLLADPQPSCEHANPQKYWSPTQEELQEMFSDFSEALIGTLSHVTKRILEKLGIEKVALKVEVKP